MQSVTGAGSLDSVNAIPGVQNRNRSNPPENSKIGSFQERRDK